MASLEESLTGLNLTPEAIQTIRETFNAYLTPLDSANDARDALKKLRQNGSSVADYTHRFRRLVRLIPNIDPGTTLYSFLTGLDKDTGIRVKLAQPSTLENAIAQATIIHSIPHPTPTSSAVSTTIPQNSCPPVKSMDLNAPRIPLAQIPRQATSDRPTALHAFSNGRRSLSKLNKLSTAEREHLRKIEPGME
ncbi:hypothetical protein BGX26_011826 [Mortierella sp. AD094]|nr:hypothetical protein BGX26_011826 [Mortierella sp. AD094]